MSATLTGFGTAIEKYLPLARHSGAYLVPFRYAFQAPENAAEEAENAAGVAACGGEAAEEQAQVVLVGFAHGGGGVAGGQHGLFD